ncbi:universal stress protein [Streptomyces humi]|uniref:universal stress protein n=1 Tax=Streptomyces humi TaxID=1428620 RepID=UPI000628981F|nr:universal stress protein [Streptomyces humi]
MNGPVVVEVDGSPSSRAAVETAAWEARRHGVGLRLAHALASPARDEWSDAAGWDPDGGGLRDRVKGLLAEAERRALRVAPHLSITSDVLIGEPVTVLKSEAEDASLAVLGGPLPRGSGIGRLIAPGQCPVLVTRGRPTPSGTVVLAVGAPSGSWRAAEFAFAEASARGADLVVPHALTVSAARLLDGPGGAIPALRKRYPEVTVRPRRGRTRRALLRAVADAQLVVVGAHGRQGLAPGSAGRTLLRHGHCSVAVVPAGKA